MTPHKFSSSSSFFVCVPQGEINGFLYGFLNRHDPALMPVLADLVPCLWVVGCPQFNRVFCCLVLSVTRVEKEVGTVHGLAQCT